MFYDGEVLVAVHSPPEEALGREGDREGDNWENASK